MRLAELTIFLLSLFTTVHALALPGSLDSIASSAKDLYKRKGGGGGRGGGGGSTSGGSRGSSGSSGSSSGSRGSGSSSTSGSTGGGRVAPSYAGGRYYGGGAATPYRAGVGRGSIAPVFLLGGLGAFGGLWLYGAYAYNYPGYYTYHNNTDGQNETHPISCVCGRYSNCGCDPNNDTDYLNSVANNASIAKVTDVNGTETLVINGTLPNDTDATTTGAAVGLRAPVLEYGGIWIVVAGISYAISTL